MALPPPVLVRGLRRRERKRRAKWINCAPQSEWVSERKEGGGRGNIVNNRKGKLRVFAECRIWRKGPY